MLRYEIFNRTFYSIIQVLLFGRYDGDWGWGQLSAEPVVDGCKYSSPCTCLVDTANSLRCGQIMVMVSERVWRLQCHLSSMGINKEGGAEVTEDVKWHQQSYIQIIPSPTTHCVICVTEFRFSSLIQRGRVTSSFHDDGKPHKFRLCSLLGIWSLSACVSTDNFLACEILYCRCRSRMTR